MAHHIGFPRRCECDRRLVWGRSSACHQQQPGAAKLQDGRGASILADQFGAENVPVEMPRTVEIADDPQYSHLDAFGGKASVHSWSLSTRTSLAPQRFMRESGDPDLISRHREIGARRLQLLSGFGPELEETGRLRPGLSGRQAIDLVWVMAGPGVYEELVLDRGWTPQQFESWLGAAVADLILVA